MPRPYSVTIKDGEASARILNGNYTVTTSVDGYNESSLDPKSITVVEGTNTYNFTVSASGTLNLRVTEEGTSESTNVVVGAKFIRCDKDGNTYGTEIVSGEDGIAKFTNVPYKDTNAPTIYYKQTSSIDDHEFDQTLKSIQMINSEYTEEIKNAKAELRTIKYTDSNYSGLPIENATITLS